MGHAYWVPACAGLTIDHCPSNIHVIPAKLVPDLRGAGIHARHSRESGNPVIFIPAQAGTQLLLHTDQARLCPESLLGNRPYTFDIRHARVCKDGRDIGRANRPGRGRGGDAARGVGLTPSFYETFQAKEDEKWQLLW